MAKEKVTLDDIVGRPQQMVIPHEHIRDILAYFKKHYSGYGPASVNKFYEKERIGRVEWEIVHTDKTVEPVSYGRLVSAIQYQNIKGTVAWKTYTYPTNIPLDFWSEVFSQVDKYLVKVEYAKKKQEEELLSIAPVQHDHTNATETVLPGSPTDEKHLGDELHFSGGVPLPNQE